MIGSYSQPVVPITATNGSSGFGGGNGDALWIFALLVLFGGGGFGGIGGRNGGGVPEVTGFQLGELSGKVATKDSISTLQNSTNQGFAGLNTVISNGFAASTAEIVNRLFNITQQVSDCCCSLKQQLADGFGQVRYDMSNFAAQTNANIADWGNKILMDNSRRAEEAKNDRLRTLELQQALCGVVRYPQAQTYNAGPYPPHASCY